VYQITLHKPNTYYSKSSSKKKYHYKPLPTNSQVKTPSLFPSPTPSFAFTKNPHHQAIYARLPSFSTTKRQHPIRNKTLLHSYPSSLISACLLHLAPYTLHPTAKSTLTHHLLSEYTPRISTYTNYNFIIALIDPVPSPLPIHSFRPLIDNLHPSSSIGFSSEPSPTTSDGVVTFSLSTASPSPSAAPSP